VVRIYSGDDGESHFENLDIPQVENGSGATVSDLVPATDVSFRTAPSGLSIDFHTAPRRQFVIPIAGIAEVETGDGSAVRLAPGDILLADDTTGRGHISRDIEGPRRTVLIPIPEDFDISAWRA
jgi:hypothetical protein